MKTRALIILIALLSCERKATSAPAPQAIVVGYVRGDLEVYQLNLADHVSCYYVDHGGTGALSCVR